MTERLVIFRANRKRYVYRVKGKGKVEVIAGPQSAYAHFGVDDGRPVYVHLLAPASSTFAPRVVPWSSSRDALRSILPFR